MLLADCQQDCLISRAVANSSGAVLGKMISPQIWARPGRRMTR
ncbi:hypothetical protein [Streptomyces sp. NPDC008139]